MKIVLAELFHVIIMKVYQSFKLQILANSLEKQTPSEKYCEHIN